MSRLLPIGENLSVVVVGATGGIGRALVKELAEDSSVSHILACSRSGAPFAADKIEPAQLSLEDEKSIEAAATWRPDCPIDIVIVTTGFLYGDDLMPEKSWRDLTTDHLLNSMRINAIGPAMVAKHFLPRLGRDRRGIFAALSARVGSISDNRLGGWYGYRASKAALNMIIKSLSIEFARINPQGICVGLHPGTVDTPLSQPFQRGVPPEQLFSPNRAARQLLDVIAARTPEDTGGVFAWDGDRVPA